MSSLLATVAPGALLAAERGEVGWPHAVFSLYWPLARSDSFQARQEPVRRRSIEVAVAV